eukprot:TRINITY_DN651_c0_g1_i1.p1 TRINITY_DN651_c0_g1~~TRINITY_DN651_c0_g1_i1.p1  ORF type:complete len:129 (+),score=14.69 TRINITY_DN651_c0_g1_i1:271-657(+)
MADLANLEDVRDLPITHQAWASKLGFVFKTWKRRWFILRGTRLFYYVSPYTSDLRGVIDLEGAVVDREFSTTPPSKNELGFTIKSKRSKTLKKTADYRDRTYYFAAESPVALEQWLEVLEKAGANVVK